MNVLILCIMKRECVALSVYYVEEDKLYQVRWLSYNHNTWKDYDPAGAYLRGWTNGAKPPPLGKKM